MKHNWEYRRLGEVCTVNFGKRIVAKETEPGQYSVYGGGGATFTTDLYNREDCMIVSRFAMSPECVRYVKGRFFLNDSGLSVSSAEKRLSQSFVDKYLWSNQDLIYNLGRGAAQKNLNIKQFTEINIPVPPMGVQERIVGELDEINGLIEAKREQLKQLDLLAQSIFYTTFGDPITNPKGWKVKSLRTVSSKIGSGATPKGGNQAYKKYGISLIRSLNIHNSHFKYENLAHIDDVQANELSNVIVEPDDVLINITGASVARCYIVPNDVLPARVNQHVAIIRLINKMNHLFLHRQLISDAYQNYLLSLASKGATRESITKAQLELLPIILPPLDLQNQFAERVEAIEARKAEVEATIKELQTLLDSRMDFWFN
ncbi:MAG: restriction endonuclease subunit S [Bacteroides sp.]|nr:restriction endonuclease subunit S [Bacteroides sp.]MCM1413174.1 restriction endonuclease subunit S [Bacteroides sp.]MCM1472084.1 restriction endonuclease subunit S [Bacteroides sp.]